MPVGSYARAAVDAYLTRARPELSRRGRATPRLFLGARGAPLSRQSAWLVIRACRRARRPHRARVAAHPAALVRDPPAAGRRRRAGRAGAARPRVGRDDADLHARLGRRAARRVRDVAPARPLTARAPGAERRRGVARIGARHGRSRGESVAVSTAGRDEDLGRRDPDRSHRASATTASRPRRRSTATARAHHLAVQPEGRRRQDDDDHQPGRRARRATAARCSRSTSTRRARCRPGLGIQTHEIPTIYDLLLDSKRDPHEVDRALARREPRRHPRQHRPVGRRGAPRQRGRARADPRRARCARSRADYDVILIDCQPSLGLLTVNALTASHGVLIPLECEFFALRGVAMLIETIDKVRDRLNPAISSTACSRRCTTRARCTRARCSSGSSTRSATTCSRRSSAAR